MSKILIIIPAFNESLSIGQVIQSILEEYPSFEIVVIDDGSTDNTGEIARKFGSVHVIRHSVNLGIGGAMQTGFLFAYTKGFDYAIQVDADGQHNTALIGKLLNAFQTSHVDMVIGSRFIDTDNSSGFRSSRSRRAGIRILRLAVFILTRQVIYDVTSGFRAYNRKAISLVAQHYPTDFPEPEAIILLNKAGLSIKEIPVIMSQRQCGVSSITGLKSIYYVFKVLIAILIYSMRPRKYYTDINFNTDTGDGFPG